MYLKKLFLYFFIFVYAIPTLTHKLVESKYPLPEHIKKSLLRKTASEKSEKAEIDDSQTSKLSEAECKQLEIEQLRQEYLKLEKRKSEILAILWRDQNQSQMDIGAQALQAEASWWNFYMQMTMNSWQFQSINYTPYEMPNLELAAQQAKMAKIQMPSLGLEQNFFNPLSSVEQMNISSARELLTPVQVQFPSLNLDQSMAPPAVPQSEYFWF